MTVTQSAGRPSTELGAGQRFCSRFQMNSPLNRTTILRVLMWKTRPAERTDAWPDAGRYAGRGEELADQAAAVSATKPCLRSILIQRGAFLATLSAS